MLSDGEFHTSVWEDGVEVWVTQMGPLMNMNTAFVDRANGIVAIIDPYDANQWSVKMDEEGLEPTHLLYTHTHRDHAAGYPGMIKRFPQLEVWGHDEARVPNLLGNIVFRKVDFTNTWSCAPGDSQYWSAGRLPERRLFSNHVHRYGTGSHPYSMQKPSLHCNWRTGHRLADTGAATSNQPDLS